MCFFHHVVSCGAGHCGATVSSWEGGVLWGKVLVLLSAPLSPSEPLLTARSVTSSQAPQSPQTTLTQRGCLPSRPPWGTSPHYASLVTSVSPIPSTLCGLASAFVPLAQPCLSWRPFLDFSPPSILDMACLSAFVLNFQRWACLEVLRLASYRQGPWASVPASVSSSAEWVVSTSQHFCDGGGFEST